MKTRQLQQGDVLLIASAIPADATAEDGEIVLAHGEATGHAHRIAARNGARLYRRGADLFLRVTGRRGVRLRHEEHGPVVIPMGDWRVGRVRERDWLRDVVRPVAD